MSWVAFTVSFVLFVVVMVMLVAASMIERAPGEQRYLRPRVLALNIGAVLLVLLWGIYY